jgi:hypothetical protein
MLRILLIVFPLVLLATHPAQSQRRIGRSAGRIRSLYDITMDKDRGKNPQDRKMTIAVEDGTVVVNNVFRDAKCSHSSSGLYWSCDITNEVTYSAGGGGTQFILTAHGSEKALPAAELRFIRLLGITKAAACRIAANGSVDGILEAVTDPAPGKSSTRASFTWCDR